MGALGALPPARRRRWAVALVGLLSWPACSGEVAVGPTTSAAVVAGRAEFTPVVGRPSAIAIDPEAGVLWVADDGDGVVRRFDAGDGSSIGPAIAVSPHPTAIEVADGVVWVADPDGTITRIDAADGVMVGTTATGGVLVDLANADGVVWAADIQAGAVWAVDASNGASRVPIVVPAGAVRLAVAGTKLWVSGIDREVTPIDRLTGTVGAAVPAGEGPIGMAADGRGTLWVVSSDSRSVARLDAADGRALAERVGVGPAPVAVAVSGDDVWILNQDGPSLSHLDAISGSAVEVAIPLSGLPRGLVASDEGVWVVCVEPSQLAWVSARG